MCMKRIWTQALNLIVGDCDYRFWGEVVGFVASRCTRHTEGLLSTPVIHDARAIYTRLELR